MTQTDADVFWELIEELQLEDPRVEEGTIMGGRCARVAGEFLGLVDFKGSGMVVKLSRERVAELIDRGVGQPFAPAGKVFTEWVSVPKRDRRRWRSLLRESIAFVAPNERQVSRRREPSKRPVVVLARASQSGADGRSRRDGGRT